MTICTTLAADPRQGLFRNTGPGDRFGLWQHSGVRDWPGRDHVETLRVWPVLAATVSRIESLPELFCGVLLLGSLSRGEGDAISDVDLAAVTQPNRWKEAWEARQQLSSGALATFDRDERRVGVAGHNWLTPNLVKVELLITAPGGMRLRGNTVVLLGEDDLFDAFEQLAPLSRQDVDGYAARLRATNAISDIERTYGDLIALLRKEIRPADDP
jgi:hypothetical protein